MDTDPSLSELRGLRWLRRLVTALTATMIVGMVVLVALFVQRFPQAGPAAVLPDSLPLPEGATVLAVTRGTGWWAVVLQLPDEREEIRLYDLDGRPTQSFVVTETNR